MTKKRLLLSILLIIVGLGMTSYSFIVNTLNDKHNSSVISSYNKTINNMEQSQIKNLITKAREYNEALVKTDVVITDPFNPDTSKEFIHRDYSSMLNTGNDLLCYVEIPCISVYLPVYHGTSKEVLQKGAGHIEGTSIPIGGPSTHSVIAAHSGLSNAKMFTDLEKMENGDVFYIHYLGKTLTYKVDKITVVEPDDTSQLYIEKDKDYVTLLTCTPYGINDHRLCVRGIRTENATIKKDAVKKKKSLWLKEYKRALKIGLTLIGILIIFLVIKRKLDSIRMKGEQKNEK